MAAFEIGEDRGLEWRRKGITATKQLTTGALPEKIRN